MKLKAQFIIPVSLFIITGIFVLMFFVTLKVKSGIENLVKGQVSSVTASAHRELSEFLSGTKTDIGIWSVSELLLSSMKSENRLSGRSYLENLSNKSGQYELLAVADTSGNIVLSSDNTMDKGVNISDREYYKNSIKGQTVVSDLIVSKVTGNVVFVVSAPLYDGDTIAGVFLGSVTLKAFTDRYIKPVKIGESGYIYMTDKDGLVTYHPVAKHIYTLNINTLDFGKQILGKTEGFVSYQFEGVDKIVSFVQDAGTGWQIMATANEKDIYSVINEVINFSAVFSVLLVAFMLAAIYLIIHSVLKVLFKTIKHAEALGSGDLTKTLEVSRKDEIGTLSDSLNDMTFKLREVMGSIRTSSRNLMSGSLQVSETSQELSKGASEQASSAEEISASIEEMTANISQTMNNSSETDRIARKTYEKGQSSHGEIADNLNAMKEINEKIKLIDEVASQTNLLALNASIEAARAGDAGKGFSVVATEISRLAERSRKIADEISQTSQKGYSGAQSATESIGDMLPSLQHTTHLVTEITQANTELNEGSNQINTAISRLDKVIQQNAAASEELAAMSEELNGQVTMMDQTISFFKIS